MTALVAFDLDDTLAHSKSPMSPEMGRLLVELLEVVPVCIISGGRFEQFQSQVLQRLPASESLADLHLMPTCGTRYMRWRQGEWDEVYAQDLSPTEKEDAAQALETSARELGYWSLNDQVHGERIEDRGSQVTYSALGQRAPVAAKKAWDPDGAKRERLRADVSARLPGLEVRAGGSTSIDVTRSGIDKAYGIRELSRMLNIPLHSVHFVGDRLEPGGNDYPVVALGVTTHAVRDCEETLEYLPELIQSLRATRSQ